jgi:hypothetical protein
MGNIQLVGEMNTKSLLIEELVRNELQLKFMLSNGMITKYGGNNKNNTSKIAVSIPNKYLRWICIILHYSHRAT